MRAFSLGSAVMDGRGRRRRRAVRAGVLAALVAAAGVAVAARARRDRGAGDAGATPVRGTTRARRRLELARVGGRAGADFALHRARRTFASAARQADLDREFELRTADQVADVLGNMKGAFMKLGQMASYLDVGLPDHVREALAGLQQDAPPMSAELTAGVVEAELGAPPTCCSPSGTRRRSPRRRSGRCTARSPATAGP